MQTAMTPGTRLAVTAFWEYAGFVVNSIVFLLVGIEVGFVDWRDKIGLAMGAVCIVLIGRAAIYPISLLVNRVKGDIPLRLAACAVLGRTARRAFDGAGFGTGQRFSTAGNA